MDFDFVQTQRSRLHALPSEDWKGLLKHLSSEVTPAEGLANIVPWLPCDGETSPLGASLCGALANDIVVQLSLEWFRNFKSVAAVCLLRWRDLRHTILNTVFFSSFSSKRHIISARGLSSGRHMTRYHLSAGRRVGACLAGSWAQAGRAPRASTAYLRSL